MAVILLSLVAVFGVVGFLAYPRFSKAIHLLTLFLFLLSLGGFYLFYLAPRDYMLNLPQDVAILFHPYKVALVSVLSFVLLFGISFGSLVSILLMKIQRKDTNGDQAGADQPTAAVNSDPY